MKNFPNEPELKIIQRLKQEAEDSLRETISRYGPGLTDMSMRLAPFQKDLARISETFDTLRPVLEKMPEIQAVYKKVIDALPTSSFSPVEKQEIPEIATHIFLDKQKSPEQMGVEIALEIRDGCLYFIGPDKTILVNRFRVDLSPHILFDYLMRNPNTPIAREQLGKRSTNLSDTLRKANISVLLKKTFFPVVTKYIVQLNPQTKVDSESYQELVNQLEATSAITKIPIDR